MKLTLVVLAAGMGSRYGGLKQLDGVGPNGETIMDYSVYDAWKAGFEKVVFVIREHFAEDFKKKVAANFEGKVEVVFAYQEVDTPVAGLEDIPEREKPWGTAHAVLVTEPYVDDPFAVINADDFYGGAGFKEVAKFLREEVRPDNNALVGYILGNTLSENGSVSRGVAEMDADKNMITVVERTKIAKEDGKIFFMGADGKVELDKDSLVSMNFWGFHPSIFPVIRKEFIQFVKAHGHEPKSEFFIPLFVNQQIQDGSCQYKVLTSHDKWHGVTYQEDKPDVMKALAGMEEYPKPLWG